MGEKKNSNTVLLTVIGVATLLVALVGATFAYFTATVSQDTSAKVDVTTSTLAGLEMKSYKQDAKVSNAVYPGWVGYQAVQVKATGSSGDKANYTLSLTANVPAAFGTDIKYSICKVENGTTAISSDLDTTFGYNPGTVAKDEKTTPGEIHYSISGAAVSLPSSGCTAVGTADTALASGSIAIATNKEITVGSSATYDLYYITYKYTNNTEAAQNAQGQQFTVEPVFTVNAAQTN